MRNSPTIRIFACAAFALAACPARLDAQQETLSARAAIQSTDLFQGESVHFQVQVQGSEKPDPPDLSPLQGDFDVRSLGGQRNSQTSVSIVNGSVSRKVQRGYVFSYELRPRKTGRVRIPALVVRAEGRAARTTPIDIQVREPVQTDDIRLQVDLSKPRSYVGEPLILTVTWYIGRDVREFEFRVPILESDAFHLADPETDTSDGRRYYRIPVAGGEAIGVKGRARLEDREYATVRFRKVLIPTESGNFEFGPATVACNALVGYRQDRGRSPFDDGFFSNFFGDDFFGGRRGVYKRVVATSEPLHLNVKALPAEGRPADFSGHVGEYRIDTTATPTDVNVGDPVTLTIVLSGPEYLEHVTLPPLSRQPGLAEGFKIPAEMADGKAAGGTKVFTQTIRVRRPDVTEIPPLRLPYFDTTAGEYRTATSDPISLTVHATKVVTAADAEGLTVESTASRIDAWARGIAHNYEDLSVLRDQRHGPDTWWRSPGRLAFFGLPPLLYVAVAGVVLVHRRRHADPLQSHARRAYAALRRELHARRSDLSVESVLDALRTYLGAKLRRPSGALTFADVEEDLRRAGLSPDALNALKDFFDRCDAGRYAGADATSGADALAQRAQDLARGIETALRKENGS